MGTVAEAWIEQGRAEGIEKGLAQGITTGQAELLLRQLELRFGELPEAVRELIFGASASEFEAWAEAVLVAESLDEVLAARPGS